MRRRRTHICEIMVIMLVIISLFTYPQSIQAKSNNAQIKKLVGKMESYEYKLLSDGKNKVKLTKTEMAKAAALSIDRNEKIKLRLLNLVKITSIKSQIRNWKRLGKIFLESRFPVRICQQPSRKIVLVMLIEKRMELQL